MLPEDLYDNLPADPEQTFLVLEHAFREECETRAAHNSDNSSMFYTEYIAQVIGAISELGLEHEFRSVVPNIEDVGYPTYLNFSKDVTHYCTRLRIRTSKRVQGFSVRFDDNAKREIHNLLTKIREVVLKLEAPEAKREAILRRVAALSEEIDRTRTRLEAFTELVLSVAGTGGLAAEKLEPIRKWIDTIGKLISDARDAEPTVKQLPPSEPPKQIDARPSPPPPSNTRDLDDEVPF